MVWDFMDYEDDDDFDDDDFDDDIMPMDEKKPEAEYDDEEED